MPSSNLGPDENKVSSHRPSYGGPAEQRHTNFFSLPAEIRNMIYQLVLTADEPLLCVMLNTNSTLKRKSKLVHLVPERKRIYSYSAEFDRAWRDLPPYNQIKSVNRQLRYETKDLEVKFNTTRFARSRARMLDATSAPENLLAFQKALSFTWFSWVSKIRLRSTNACLVAPEHGFPVELSTIVAFCKANPQIQVQFVLRGFCFRQNNCKKRPRPRVRIDLFLLMGVIISLPLQSKDDSVNTKDIVDEVLPASVLRDIVSSSACLLKEAMPFGGCDSLEQNLPGIGDLTFFADENAIDDAEFAGFYYGVPAKLVSSVSQQQQKYWLKWAKTWVNDGIKCKL